MILSIISCFRLQIKKANQLHHIFIRLKSGNEVYYRLPAVRSDAMM